jgi:hypothetical protein
MPYFETNPAEIEVAVDEFLSACDSDDIADLIQTLIDDGYLPKYLTSSIVNSLASNEFDEAVSKLFGNHWRLTNEDTDTIMKVANKL